MRTEFDTNRPTPQHGRLTSIATEVFHSIQQGFAWWEAHRQWPATEPATIPDSTSDLRQSPSRFTA